MSTVERIPEIFALYKYLRQDTLSKMFQFATNKTRWISCQTLGWSRQLLNTRINHNIDSHIWRPPHPTLRSTVLVDSTGRDFGITPVTSAYKPYGLTNNKSLISYVSQNLKQSKLMRLWYLPHRRQAKAYASQRSRSVSPEPSLFAMWSLEVGKESDLNSDIYPPPPCAFEEWVYCG